MTSFYRTCAVSVSLIVACSLLACVYCVLILYMLTNNWQTSSWPGGGWVVKCINGGVVLVKKMSVNNPISDLCS